MCWEQTENSAVNESTGLKRHKFDDFNGGVCMKESFELSEISSGTGDLNFFINMIYGKGSSDDTPAS